MFIWLGAALGALVAFLLALRFAPARTNIIVDTAASAARAELTLLWGLGPTIVKRALPKDETGAPLAVFNDAQLIGHALMTPGIADVTIGAYERLFAFDPKRARLELGLNLGDSAKNLVVQTSVEAALASAPLPVRQSVTLQKCGAPGAEFSVRMELSASPAALDAIYGRFKSSRAVREFRKRLKQKVKGKAAKAPREVRAS